MDNKVLIRREKNYFQVEVEASPAIMASLTSMEQDVPSLQVGVGWKRKLWQLASEVKVKVKVMATGKRSEGESESYGIRRVSSNNTKVKSVIPGRVRGSL